MKHIKNTHCVIENYEDDGPHEGGGSYTQNTLSSDLIISEYMQNIQSKCNSNYAKIGFPETKFKIKHEPPRCVRVQQKWNNKEELSSNSSCVCPFGNKVETIINNQKFYKCDVYYTDTKK